MIVEIVEYVSGWPYNAIRNNWADNQQKWQTVDEKFFWDQLGSVPPLCHTGEPNSEQFLVGECAFQDDTGEAYCGVINIGEVYYAKYCYGKQFVEDCLLLKQHLSK